MFRGIELKWVSMTGVGKLGLLRVEEGIRLYFVGAIAWLPYLSEVLLCTLAKAVDFMIYLKSDRISGVPNIHPGVTGQ